MVRLDGYDDEGLAFDASGLLSRPGFWAAFLGPILGADLDGELAELFGVPLGLIRGCYRRLTDTAGWPVFLVGLNDASALGVVFRNADEEEAVDFLLLPGGGVDAIRVALAEGSVDGPGISWEELVAVADRQPDPLGRAQAALLLAAMLGDGLAEPARLAAALRVVGVGGGAEAIADRLVAAAPAEWRRSGDGLTVCDHAGSARNPDGRGALPAGDLRTVSELLG
jgi:hypothetical protein